jgi:hypothetical protein
VGNLRWCVPKTIMYKVPNSKYQLLLFCITNHQISGLKHQPFVTQLFETEMWAILSCVLLVLVCLIQVPVVRFEISLGRLA